MCCGMYIEPQSAGLSVGVFLYYVGAYVDPSSAVLDMRYYIAYNTT
jgi:hypothetical protein